MPDEIKTDAYGNPIAADVPPTDVTAPAQSEAEAANNPVDGKSPETAPKPEEGTGDGTTAPGDKAEPDLSEANAVINEVLGEDDEDTDPNGAEAPEGEVRSIVNQFKPAVAINNLGETVKPAEEEGLPPEELDGSLPMHNDAGHRCAFVNLKGQMTIMDDETAAMFYDEPSFYSYVYDAHAGDRVHVSTLRWCDRHGAPTGGDVGHPYEINE